MSLLVLTVFLCCSGTWEQHHSLPERRHLEWLLPCLPGDARPVLGSKPAQQQPQTAVPWWLCHRYDGPKRGAVGGEIPSSNSGLMPGWVIEHPDHMSPCIGTMEREMNECRPCSSKKRIRDTDMVTHWWVSVNSYTRIQKSCQVPRWGGHRRLPEEGMLTWGFEKACRGRNAIAGRINSVTEEQELWKHISHLGKQ